MKMTPRENLLSLYRRQGYEYVPAAINLCGEQMEVFAQKTGLAGWDKAYEYFGVPFLFVQDLLQNRPDPSEFMRYHSKKDIDDGISISEWGVGFDFSAGAHYRMIHPLAGDVSLDDLLSYPLLTLCHDNEADQRREVEAIQGAGLAAYGNLQCTVWETSWYIRGMEDLMMDMLTEDEKATVLMDIVTDISRERAAAFARAGVDILFLGDDIGMQQSTMMSTDLYRQWLKPRLAKVIQAAREEKPDILIQYHSCGYVEPFIEDLIEAGVDILNPVQPECMSFAGLHARYGDRLSFNGVLGTQSTMPFGTPEEVRQVVFESLDIAGEKGGLLCCPTHEVEPDVPWENIAAYWEACKEYTAKKLK